MSKVMTVKEFVNKAKDIANNYKTLYVMGCFGAPLNSTNKKRYTNNHNYNKQASRTKMINGATSDTFGFDCVCLIKGILWGWCGNKNHVYGGANYCSNGVKDMGADSIISSTYCTDVSTNFNNIAVGEIVWLSGHVGIYVGDGLVVECTPAWKNKVQITKLSQRKWLKHGKLRYVDYTIVTPKKTVEEIAQEVIAGKWGNYPKRKELLEQADYNYSEVQTKVNELVKAKPKLKSTDEIAREVIAGKWGNGADRKNRLTKAGYNYKTIQNRVNQLLR
jgi:hypothetical protein